MKQIQMSHCKTALLALASVALLTPVVRGATITPNMGDVILGFRATASGSQGETANLEVDLGPVSQFYGLTPGQTIALPTLSVLDISATYGANWITRSDLFWGAIATAGRASAYVSGSVNVPVGTLWATAPNCAAAWNKGSSFAQKNASSAIEAAFVAGSPLYGATSTANSTGATVIGATVPGSWKAQDMKTAGTSFGYFNPSIDNYEGTNIVVSQLYELQPGTGAGTHLGDLILTASGLSFQAASPLTIVASNLTVQASGDCTATTDAEAVGSASTGYCLSLSLDASGPFPIGTTNVTLTAVDGSGASTSAVATVTVVAGAPVVASHSNISTNVASGCSAAVSFTAPTATGCATPIDVVCSPASGTSFTVGTHIVTCTGTDAASRTGTSSFTVTVNGAGIAGVVQAVNAVSNAVNVVRVGSKTVTNTLTPARLNSLLSSLNLAATDLAKTNANQQTAKVLQACGQLNGFITKVKVYEKVGILSTNAGAALINAATAEKTAIGCRN